MTNPKLELEPRIVNLEIDIDKMSVTMTGYSGLREGAGDDEIKTWELFTKGLEIFLKKISRVKEEK